MMMKTKKLIEVGYFEDDKFYFGESDNGFIYKNEEAFLNKKGICYIPSYTFEELGDAITLQEIGDGDCAAYTYSDLLNAVCGNEESAKFLFDCLDWTHPETELQNLEQVDYGVCYECGTIYDEQEGHESCPNCTKNEVSKPQTCEPSIEECYVLENNQLVKKKKIYLV